MYNPSGSDGLLCSDLVCKTCWQQKVRLNLGDGQHTAWLQNLSAAYLDWKEGVLTSEVPLQRDFHVLRLQQQVSLHSGSLMLNSLPLRHNFTIWPVTTLQIKKEKAAMNAWRVSGSQA